MALVLGHTLWIAHDTFLKSMRSSARRCQLAIPPRFNELRMRYAYESTSNLQLVLSTFHRYTDELF